MTAFRSRGSGDLHAPDVSPGLPAAGSPPGPAAHDTAGVTTTPPQARARWSAVPRGLLSATRPEQWLKNFLVFAAPAAAGSLDHLPALLDASVAFLAFTLAAAGTYLLNDVRDVASDRLHPRKRHRPIAAGVVRPGAAIVVAVAAFVAALVAGAWLGWPFVAVLILYVALTTSYSVWMKNVPVLDIVAVATGFLLRAIGGGVATAVPLSDWFLLVAMFGALLLVVGKRYSEQLALGAGSPTRATLAGYPPGFLGQLTTVAMTGTLLGYAAWAFQYLGGEVSHPLLALSLLPFSVAILRYGLIIAAGGAENPERVAVTDRFLLVAALCWLALVAGGLYLA